MVIIKQSDTTPQDDIFTHISITVVNNCSYFFVSTTVFWSVGVEYALVNWDESVGAWTGNSFKLMSLIFFVCWHLTCIAWVDIYF